MATNLNDTLNALSLMVVNGGATRETLVGACQAFHAAAVEQGMGRILETIFVPALSLTDKDACTEKISELLAVAQRLLDTGTSGSSAPSIVTHPSSEVTGDMDRPLLIEFIEKHISALEEFESVVMVRVRGEDPRPESDYTTWVKGYLHNLKGDAGSVGVIGIERVCHAMEDQLSAQGATPLGEALIAFREWATATLTAVADQTPLPKLSAEFITELQSIIAEQAPAGKPSTGTMDVPAGANLDLLAELMAEPAAAPATSSDAASSSDSYEMVADKDIFLEFATEADDHLANIETTLLETQGTFDKESIDRIFRAAHSLKGASSYFKLEEIRETSHLTEDVLDEVRNGKRTMDQGLINLLLTYKDLQQTLLTTAKRALEADGCIQRNPKAHEYLVALKAYKNGAAPAATKVETPVAVPASAQKAAPAAADADKLDIKTFVKVDTKRLDLLIDSIGEMVIYSSMLIQRCRHQFSGDEGLGKITHQVEKFSRDLQNIGMSMRLIPIRGLFQKMSRLVWDTAKKINKEIKFTMEGEDTELDRNIIDQLADPLMHMIRNAIDHGVETPSEREAKGKPRCGNIQLRAYHSGGSIHIEIVDDGRGLNPEKLLAKAREKGIIQENQELSLQETYKLIFAAGFSTAAVVTDISGRGVGMDVVRRNIEGMRGHIHIKSEIDQGTTFVIELPLTLAIIDGILVQVGREQLIIPTLSIVELTKAAPGTITRALDKGETFQFRGRYLPLFRISRLLGIEPRIGPDDTGTIVVTESNGDLTAFVVEEVLGAYSTVIKNLSDVFENREGIAGCAIMANGDVALIVDVRSLVTLARHSYPHQVVTPTVPLSKEVEVRIG